MFAAMLLRSCAAKRRKILRSYALFRFRKRKFGRFGRSVWGGPKDTLRAFGGGHGPVAPPLDPRLIAALKLNRSARVTGRGECEW